MRAALLHNSTALLKEKLLRRHPKDNSKLTESSITFYPGSSFVPDQEKYSIASIYDADNASENTESSREENEYLERDIVSLHSAHSHEIWDLEPSDNIPKRNPIWAK